MLTTIRNMIRQAFVSLLFDDSEAYPIVQISANGKKAKAVRLSIYGVVSHPPRNSHALVFNSQGQESTKFAIINDFLNRKKGLKEGEAALFNTLTGAFVLMKENGDIEIETSANVNISGADLTLTGDITLDGDVVCNGDLDMSGNDILDTGLVDGVDIENHLHFSEVPTGTNNTGPPV